MTDETRKDANRGKNGETDGLDAAARAAQAGLGGEAEHEGDDGDDVFAFSDAANDDLPPDNSDALAILVEGLKNENGELKDKYLRLAAEMDNLRRRTERDVKDARSYSIANFARDMLAVSDNLRRALEAVTAEQRDAGDAGFKGLIEGVEMTERSMLTTLERHGVTPLAPEGQKFDANFHQAMFEVPNAEVPNNTVVQVVQTGYVIGGRVLRPAMVGVAKGGPKQPAETLATRADDAEEPSSHGEGSAEPGAPNAEAEKDA